MATRCAFCSNDAVEHGGEHIWDRWLNDWLPVSEHEITYSSLSGEARRYSKKRIDEKLPVVCAMCNTGWMSGVTHRIKDNFKYVIRDGSPISVLPSGVSLLAAFTLMKAAVATHAIAESEEPFFARSVKERLRESLAVPSKAVKMWIGAFQGKSLYSGRFNSGVVAPNPGPLYGMEYFTFTYVAGQLVLQLCAGRWKHVHHRGRSDIPMLKPNSYWNPASIQFWPSDGAPIEWPPSKYFNDASLKEFIDRFKNPIDLRM